MTARIIIDLTVVESLNFENTELKIMPHKAPTTIPKIIETGIFTKLFIETLSPFAMPVKVVNITITKTSSTEAPVSII